MVLGDLKLEIFLGVPVRELNASEVETYYRVYKDRYPNDVRPRERLFTPFLEPFDTNATYIPAIAVPILDDAPLDGLGDAFRTAGFPRALSDIVTTLEKFDRAIRGNKIILDFLEGINHQRRNHRPTMTSSFDIESLDFEGYARILLEKEAAEKAALEKAVAEREATRKEATEKTTTERTTTMQTTMATDHLNDVDASLLSALALEDDHSIVSPSPAQPFGSTSRLLAFISAQLNLNNLSVEDHQAALIDLIDDYHRRVGLPSDNEGGEEHQQEEEEEEVAEEAEEAEDDDEEEEDELDMPAVQGNLPTIHELMVEVNKRANSCKSLANNHLRQVESMLKEVQAINAASRANEALLAEATASANASEAAARAALAASYAEFPPEPASGSGAGSAAGAGPSSAAAASGGSKKKSKSKGKRKSKGKGKGRKK